VAIIKDKEIRKTILSDVQTDVQTSLYERSGIEPKWNKWRRQAEARPERATKDFPWEKASNVCVPMAGTKINGIFARLKGTFAAKKPMWSIEANTEALYQHAECMESLLNTLAESRFHLNMRKVNNTIFKDVVTLGTQFVEVAWLHETQSYKTNENEQITRTIHNGPAVIPIRIEDFICRAYVTDIQRATMIHHRHRFTKEELLYRQSMGEFTNVDRVLSATDDTFYDTNKEQEQSRIGIYESTPELIEIYKTFYKYDLDGDGIAEDIIIWHEVSTGVILREEYNTLGYRPYVRIPYLPISYQLYAMGVGWMCEHMQDETDTLHNMRIDGTHMATCPIAVAKNGTQASKEKIHPGKMFKVDSPREDMIFTQFPPPNQVSIQSEYMVREYVDQFTGATAAMMGQGDPYAKTRATASGTMFLAQQGNYLFDAIAENVMEAYSEIGLLIILQLIHADQDEVLYALVPTEKHEYLREILEMPDEDIHLKFNFQVNVTEVDQTEEAEKQKLLTMMQLYTMYGQNMYQLLTITSQLGMQEAVGWIQRFLTKLIEGQTNMMGEIVGKFGLPAKDFIPVVSDIKMLNEALRSQVNERVQGAAAQGSAPGNPVGEPGNTQNVQGSY
jgi:hypothetical protein